MLTTHLKIKNKIYRCNYQLSETVLPNAASTPITLFPHIQGKPSLYNHKEFCAFITTKTGLHKFSNIYQPYQNSRHQDGDVNQVPY
jgi:hypothetical protein